MKREVLSPAKHCCEDEERSLITYKALLWGGTGLFTYKALCLFTYKALLWEWTDVLSLTAARTCLSPQFPFPWLHAHCFFYSFSAAAVAQYVHSYGGDGGRREAGRLEMSPDIEHRRHVRYSERRRGAEENRKCTGMKWKLVHIFISLFVFFSPLCLHSLSGAVFRAVAI